MKILLYLATGVVLDADSIMEYAKGNEVAMFDATFTQVGIDDPLFRDRLMCGSRNIVHIPPGGFYEFDMSLRHGNSSLEITTYGKYPFSI